MARWIRDRNSYEKDHYYEAEIELWLFITNDIIITSDKWTPPFGPDNSSDIDLISFT